MARQLKTPLVSVVMPVRNADLFLQEAIESILNQTLEDLELVVVCDPSNDRSLSIVARYAELDNRVRVIMNKKQCGLSKSRSQGITASKSVFIAMMDADDVSLPHRLAEQFSFLRRNPDIGAVGSSIILIDEKGRTLGIRDYPKKDPDIRRSMFRHSPFAQPAVMIRKGLLDLAGQYVTSMDLCEDIELYFRLGKLTHFANLSPPLFKYRVYLNSTSNRKLRRTIYCTANIRARAAICLGYRVTFFDVLFNLLALLTILLPSGVTVKLFNLLRGIVPMR